MSLRFTLNILRILLFAYAIPSFASELTHKKSIVDKHLNSKITFEKKIKVLVAFQIWTDKEVSTNSDKLNDEDLTQVMQYSNLLKAIAAKNLNAKNCKSASEKLIDEDLTPASNEPSQPAKTILAWLKLICFPLK